MNMIIIIFKETLLSIFYCLHCLANVPNRVIMKSERFLMWRLTFDLSLRSLAELEKDVYSIKSGLKALEAVSILFYIPVAYSDFGYEQYRGTLLAFFCSETKVSQALK